MLGRPEIAVAELVADGDRFSTKGPGLGLYWVDVNRPGAKEYVQGYVRYFAALGVRYLRVDFLSWFETGTRYVDEGQGVFAMSRTDAAKGIEYVVAVNNGWSDKQVQIPTYSRDMAFTKLYPAGSETQYTNIDKKLTITVPKMSVTVFKAAKAVAKSSAAPSVSLTGMTPGATITDRWQVKARTSNQGGSNDQVTFVAKVGNGAWKSIGTDDNPGWSVWFDPSGVPTGTQVTFRAIVTDNNGHSRVSNGVVQVIGANASERAQKAPVDTPKSLQPQQRGR